MPKPSKWTGQADPDDQQSSCTLRPMRRSPSFKRQKSLPRTGSRSRCFTPPSPSTGTSQSTLPLVWRPGTALRGQRSACSSAKWTSSTLITASQPASDAHLPAEQMHLVAERSGLCQLCRRQAAAGGWPGTRTQALGSHAWVSLVLSKALAAPPSFLTVESG